MKATASLVDPPRHRAPWLHPSDLSVGWVGAALMFPIEMVILRPTTLDLMATTMALFAALGAIVGLAVAGGSAAARGVAGATARAFVLAMPSLLVTIPVGLRLFDGAKASTLPGAAWAPLWFPLFNLLALACFIWSAERTLTTRARRVGFALALLVGAAGLEWINRNVQRSGYPDLHTLLLVATCASAGLAARGFEAALRQPSPASTRTATLGTRWGLILSLAAFSAALVFGLKNSKSRWQMATQGLHTRLLVRASHGVFDLDRDGYARVLGGGDCDNLDSAVHPGARELPHNGRDENCDGRDDDVAASALAQQRRAQRTEADEWRTSVAFKQQLERTRAMNLVLLSIDALRADVLDGSEASRKRYPHLSRLLAESQYFTRAFAPSAGTDLSMSGVLTGQVDPFATTAPTLAEALKRSGRRTYAVIPSEVARYVGKPMLARGVDEYKELVNDLYEKDVGSHSTSARTTELGLAFLTSHEERHSATPFFLWMHYFDVHEHDELQTSDKRVRAALGTATGLSRREKYQRLVTLVDEQVGVVLQDLARRSAAGNTVVVLLSDHGEGLSEDRRLPENHGRFVYNALTHVPLALRVPGLEGRPIDHPVSLLDLYPTLIELLTGQTVNVDGNSFLPQFLPGAPDTLKQRFHPLPLNESDQFGVIVWPYKLLVRRRENLSELYDLQSDFAESRNLAANDRARVEALLATYSALPRVDLDRTTRGRLARNRAALRGAQGGEDLQQGQHQR